MATAKKAAPNPFASAVRKPTAAAKKSVGNIIIAQDITTYNGAKFSKQEVADAVTSYSEGHRMFEQGKAMKETNRDVLLAVGRTKQAEKWLADGTRPDSPKIHAQDDGGGEFATIVFMDTVNKLDDDKYALLAQTIGAAAAEENTLRRDDFIINPELLGTKTRVIIDGKPQELTVMDAIAASLQATFAPSPLILADLFQVQSKFETKKGLLDKGLALVGDKGPATASKLAEFIEISRVVTQVKVGGGKSD